MEHSVIEIGQKPRSRGRPRKYATKEEYIEKSKENMAKYKKEHAEALRQQNKEYYIRKNYLNNQIRSKYHTTYSEMYGSCIST